MSSEKAPIATHSLSWHLPSQLCPGHWGSAKARGAGWPPLHADELWPWKRPHLWGPVFSSMTRRACGSLEDPSSSRRPSDLPDSHMCHLRMAAHARNEVSLPSEASQSAGTLSLAYSPTKTSQDGLISSSLTIILKNNIFECAESSKIWASSWTFSYPEAQFPCQHVSIFSLWFG